MKEAVVQKWVRDQLQKEYGEYCVYIKYHAGQYATRGVSDLIFCIHGIYVAIEVKTETGTPTKLQLRFLNSVKTAGGVAAIIYGKDQDRINAIIKQINRKSGKSIPIDKL